MRVEVSACILCGACSGVCPVNVIEVSSTKVSVREGCTNCGLCAKVCPMGAIEVGTSMGRTKKGRMMGARK